MSRARQLGFARWGRTVWGETIHVTVVVEFPS